MRVRLEAFAIAREKLGFSRKDHETPAATVGELRRELIANRPDAAQVIRASRMAMDGAYVDDDSPLRDGAEVSLIPPVSGGVAACGGRVFVGPDPIRLDEALAAVSSRDTGGIVYFIGTVRAENEGARVVAIDYESKSGMAERELEKLIVEATERFGITAAFIRHRIGRIGVGEASVVIVTAAAHRAPAYDANRWLLDRLKEIAPIWKHEERLRDDGTSEKVWLGAGGG